RHAGVLEGEPIEQKREKLLAVMGQRLPAATRRARVALLGEIANIPFRTGAQPGKDAMLIGDMMRAAWEEWLDAGGQAQPVLIVLEDLHWGDVPSIRLVDQVLRNLRERPLFVLALGRPEVRERFPDLWAEREVSEVRVGALSRRASERLIRAALGDAV